MGKLRKIIGNNGKKEKRVRVTSPQVYFWSLNLHRSTIDSFCGDGMILGTFLILKKWMVLELKLSDYKEYYPNI